MNAEALAHAAKACLESSEAVTKAADRADSFLHAYPDAGLGMVREAAHIRRRAIGLKVAHAFLDRCARQADIANILADLERGADVWVLPYEEPVVVGDDQGAPARPTLRDRINALLRWRAPAKAA